MANEQNLVPQSERTKSEQRKIARLGGIKSGESRRARKTLKEELLALLSQGDIQEKISLALLEKAKKGDVKAFETMRDTIGEKPTEKVENTNVEISYEDYINKVADDNEY